MDARQNTLAFPATMQGSNVDLTGIHLEINRLEDKLDQIQVDVNKRMEEHSDGISYHNLGFRDPSEADSWIEEHSPQGKYGLMIDFHIMMEHIEQKVRGVDALARLEKVHKIKLPSNSEAVAISSFQSMIPRFFSKPGEYLVIDNTESYFTNIKSFSDWNNSASGYKVQLKKQMERFRKYQLATIKAKLSPESKLYSLAIASVSDTIAWTYEFINYLDVTYAEYAEGKFGAKKAWHVTTKLANALILEVSKPRESTFNELETSAINVSFNARVVFYNTLKSLDVMAEISSMNFTDYPAVSTELVKFLSLNTSVEAVDKLTEKSETMGVTVSALQRDVVGAVKTATTVGNKQENLASQLKELTKQVTKLSNKVN